MIETTLALMNLEDTQDAVLPNVSSNLRTLADVFSAAYTAMRRGNLGATVLALRAGQATANRDVFSFLINDPVFSAYRQEKEIALFYR